MSFGVKGNVHAWFTSYVSGRFQSVTVAGNVSNPSPLLYGVPHGSVLGSVLFTLYSQPLFDVIHKHDCPFHKPMTSRYHNLMYLRILGQPRHPFRSVSVPSHTGWTVTSLRVVEWVTLLRFLFGVLINTRFAFFLNFRISNC